MVARACRNHTASHIFAPSEVQPRTPGAQAVPLRLSDAALRAHAWLHRQAAGDELEAAAEVLQRRVVVHAMDPRAASLQR